MELSDIVREDVVTVSLDDSLLEVAEVMRQRRVGSAVVLDPAGEVLGVVTDRDLVVYGQGFADALTETAVNEIISLAPVSVGPDTDLLDLTERMREEGVRRVPVVEDGDLVGIVTLDDVVVALAGELESPALANLAAVIERASPRNGDPA